LVSARVRLAGAAATAFGSDLPKESALLDHALIRAAGRGPCEASTTVPAMAKKSRAATATMRVRRVVVNDACHRGPGFACCLAAGCGGGWSAGSWVLAFSSAPIGLAACARLEPSTASGVWTTSGSACASMTSWSTADSSPQKSGNGPAASSRTGSLRSSAVAPAVGPNGMSSSGGPSHSRGSRTTFPASAAARPLPPLASRSSNFRVDDSGAARAARRPSALIASAGDRDNISLKLVPVCLNWR